MFYLITAFVVIAIDNKSKKSICNAPIWTKNYRRSIISLKYEVGTCVILFTMNWGSHQGVVIGLIYLCYQTGRLSKLRNGTIKLYFTATQRNTRNSCLLHETEQKKDILTLHEEVNPLVY